MARHTEPVIQLGEGRIGRTSAADDYLQIHLMAKNGTRRSVRIKAKRSIDGEKGRLVARVIGERDIRVLAEGALYFKDGAVGIRLERRSDANTHSAFELNDAVVLLTFER